MKQQRKRRQAKATRNTQQGKRRRTRRIRRPMTFHEFTQTMQALHDRKGKGYDGVRQYENHRAVEAFGFAPWVYPVIRANEKLKRLARAASGQDEGVVDVLEELVDIANLAGIAWVLKQEQP